MRFHALVTESCFLLWNRQEGNTWSSYYTIYCAQIGSRALACTCRSMLKSYASLPVAQTFKIDGPRAGLSSTVSTLRCAADGIDDFTCNRQTIQVSTFTCVLTPTFGEWRVIRTAVNYYCTFQMSGLRNPVMLGILFFNQTRLQIAPGVCMHGKEEKRLLDDPG